jgi:hypothetical protein
MYDKIDELNKMDSHLSRNSELLLDSILSRDTDGMKKYLKLFIDHLEYFNNTVEKIEKENK